MKKRKVYAGEVHHICQMTVGKVVIFYSVADYLVFFTIYCTFAERYEVDVLALCPMPDHIHCVVIVRNAQQLAKFVGGYTREFAHLWNKSRRRKGFLFQHNYQSAVKMGAKQVRTVITYNYNNPVERQIVKRADEYRWNYLAYAKTATPFSVSNHSESTFLRTAKKEVRMCRERGDYLNHAQIERLLSKLTLEERHALIDYIVGLWNVIDYARAISYYGSLETMKRAFQDNTGGEYDIKEDRDNYSDAVYSDCTRILLSEKMVLSVYEIPTLPMEKKQQMYRILRQRTSAKAKQLRKYLHIADHELLD